MADISKLKPNGATGTEYNIIDDDYRNTDHTFTMNTYSSYSHTFEDTQISQRMPVRNVFTGIQSLFNSVKTAINDHGSLFGDIATALAFRVTKDNATYKALNFHSYDHTIDDSMELTTQFDGAGEMGCVWFTNTNLGVITDAVNDHAEWIAKETAGSKTVTGNPLTITDAAGIKAEKIEIGFEPKQDKHGYDKPWVGGAGKNKLPMTVAGIKAANSGATWNGNVGTLNGMTFTINTDSDGNFTGLKCAGPSNGCTFVLFDGSATISSGSKYNLSANRNNNTFDSSVMNGSTSIGYISGNTASTADVTLSDTTVTKITLYFNRNYTDTLTLYPMIRNSADSATFEPPSNISPITGYTSLSADDWGKNFLKLNGEEDSLNNITLTPVKDSSGNVIKMHVQGTATANVNRGIGKLVSNLNRRIKFVIDSVPSGISRFYLWDNTTSTMAKDNIVNGTEHTISNDHSYSFAITVPNGNSVNGDIQAMAVNADETDLSFVPYKSITIQLGQTLYGGKLTILQDGSAVFVGDKASVDLGSLNWIYTVDYLFYSPDETLGEKRVEGITMISSAYKGVPNVAGADYVTENGTICGINNTSYHRIYIKDNRYTSAAALKTAVTGQQLVYELATPFTLHLPPVETLTLLQGINNVWTDGTTLSLTYQPDNAIGQAKGTAQEIGEKLNESLVGNYSRNLVEDKIAGYNIDSVGRISYDASFDMQIAKIRQGETYTVTTNDYLIAGFFVSKPTTTSQSYDNTRVVNTQSKTFIAPIDGYVAFRTQAGYTTPQCELGTEATYYEPYIPTNTELYEMIKALQS